MWEVRVEEYSRFTHKTLATKYQFDREADAIDFINNLKKEIQNAVFGFIIYTKMLYAVTTLMLRMNTILCVFR